MPIPSFDELLSEARRISRDRTDAQGFRTGEVAAFGISDFVNRLLTTQGKDHQTYVAGADPKTGGVSTFAQPQTSGRSLMERMVGVPGLEANPGQIPLTSDQAAIFALQKAKEVPSEPRRSPFLISEKKAKQMEDAGTLDPTKYDYKIFGSSDKPAAPDKKLTEKLDNAKTALSILTHLEDTFSGLPSGMGALASKGASLATFGKFGNKNQRVYDDALKANAVKFYRAYTSDTRLSDADARERAMGIVPGSSLDKDVAKGKFSEIRGNVLREIAPILERQGISESEFLASISGGGSTGAPDKTGYIVGQKYKMKDGNMAVYKGNGSFE